MKLKTLFAFCLIIVVFSGIACKGTKEEISSLPVFSGEISEIWRGKISGHVYVWKYGPSIEERFCIVEVEHPRDNIVEGFRLELSVQGQNIPAHGFQRGEEVYFFLAGYRYEGANQLFLIRSPHLVIPVLLPTNLAKREMATERWKLMNPKPDKK